MAIITDATGRQLVNNVGNINTSGLMTDTTGQNIVSAINNLGSAISPSANNVTFNNTGTGLSASNVQDAIVEVDTSLDVLNATSTSITRYTGVSSSVPLPAVSRRGKIVIIHFAHLLPAGTYLNIWNVSPTPASQQHAIVSLGSDTKIITVLNTGIVKFNNSVIINNDSYVIGQLIYNIN